MQEAEQVAFTARAACEGVGICADCWVHSNATRWCCDSQGLGLHMVISAGQEAERCVWVCVCVYARVREWARDYQPAKLGQSTGIGGSGQYSAPFLHRQHLPSRRPGGKKEPAGAQLRSGNGRPLWLE